jgi:hypothetical protein
MVTGLPAVKTARERILSRDRGSITKSKKEEKREQY